MKTKQACVPIDLCRENIFLKMLCSVCFIIRGRIFSFTRERAMLSNDVHYVGTVVGIAMLHCSLAPNRASTAARLFRVLGK